MKKTLRLVAVFALMGATLAYTGCTDYSKDFDDINNRIEALESGKLKSVEEQVAGLKSTVASLEDAKSKAEAAIAELQKNSATAADLKALEAKLDAAVKDAASKAAVEDLKSKIEKLEADLAKYAKVETLNAEVEKLNKAIADAKALTEKEFATVNDKIKAITDWQVEAVAKLGALEGQIKTLEEGLATSQQDIITLTEGLKSVSAATGILEDEVEKIYDELNIAWDRIRELTEGLRSTTAGLAIAEQDIIALQTDMADVKEALKALKEASAKHVTADDVKEAVKTAVAEAIANDGVISAEIAKAVKAATDKLQAQIDAIKNVVKNLTEQIQSIVYVPETKDGKMSAAIYKLGKDFSTPVMIRATYEITPRELVSSISASNLCASSVAVKAAPAEVFPVRIMNADPATGRLDVRIDVPAESVAYKVLTAAGPTWATPSVALALNISESKISTIPGDDDTMIDTGCKKSSSYVTVDRTGAMTPVDLATAVRITKDGKEVASPASKNYDVYYDDKESERVLFAGFDVAMKIGDDLMSLKEAGEFFGTNFKLAHKTTVAYEDATGSAIKDATKSPVKIEGEDLSTTAKIQPLKTVFGSLMVGYNATVTLNKFTLNGNATGLSLSSKYEIVKTVSTIQYPDQEIDWTYACINSTIAKPHYTEIFEEVIGKGSADATAKLERYEFTDGKWVKVALSTTKPEVATPNAKSTEGEYNVTGKIKFENLRFTPGKRVKYVASYNITDKNDAQRQYAVSCDVYLDGMPANKTINLGTVEVVRNYTTAKTTVALEPITATFNEDKAFYPQFGGDVNAFIKTYNGSSPKYQPIVVKEDGTAAAATGYSFTFANNTDKKGNVVGEISTLSIPKASAIASDEIEISMPVVAFGVTYTYKVKVQLSDPTSYTLKTNATRVDPTTYVALVGGTKTFGKAAGTTVPSEPSNLAVRSDYALNEVVLSDYVYVDNYNTAEALVVEFDRITIDSKGKPVYSNVATVDVLAKGILDKTAKLNWATSEVEYKLRATLKLKNNTSATDDLGQVVFTLQPKTIIDKFENKAANLTVVSGTEKSVNLFNYLSVIDYAGQELVYSSAKAMADMWDYSGSYTSGKNTVYYTVPGFYNVYGQKVTFEPDQDKVVVKHNGTVIPNSLVNYTYSDTAGTITLHANNADLLGEITFEIPVKLTYNYGTAETATVIVNITQK